MSQNILGNRPQYQGDPLIVALLLAGALHALLLLGVSFTFEPDAVREAPPPLDIALLPRQNTETPEEADYLAEHSQTGTGNVDERVEPTPPQPAQQASAPPPEPAPEQPQVMTQAESPTRVAPSEAEPRPEAPRPSASELIEHSMELANLDQQIRQSLQAYSERPRKTFVSASTREYKYASYMSDWVRKVERVGNLNYPDAARRQGVSGKLLLQVALKPDGSIHGITLLKSSGHQVLDDAAIRIVELAAPFPPLPDDIRKDTDLLYITRTWEFLSSGLQTQGR
ncbi:cell envelope biogenesis protein TonB [Thiohalobacter sp. COW1]|uniref:Periplasmic protein TonB n=1 Tax=Thiohalobacter thiocyanaticus TaxID=585455 RepID=A0A1Z4VUR4_9GAMM|nr:MULTISPECIES: energy transducer TonB [Thiohalobacter]BAZ95366.1 periplasmic protein TonB [Thiohalobacter thiocyanaticus]BCO32683.1 cell envelope biogenesis protein TonB [Thiohalobacter sp. COW1]